MTASRHLLLLGLGLCLVTSYVHSLPEEVNVYGADPKNPYEDVTWQLEKQRAEKRKLEELLEKTTNPKQRSKIEKDLDKIITALGKMELKFRVVYRDHIQAVKSRTQDFENEKANLKKELEAAEKRHATALADMQEAKNKDRQQIGAYQAKLEESTNQMEKLERDYAALKEIQTQKLEKEKQEKEELIKVRDELTKKLQDAQSLHAKAMEALSSSFSQESVNPPALPHANEIIALKKQLIAVLNTKDKQKRLAGLTKLYVSLRDLYESLYKESNLSHNVSHKDLEEALSFMKKTTKHTRREQAKHRHILVEQIQKKKLGDYTEKEIEALQKTNKEVESSDLVLREVARRKAFLTSIKEVAPLIKQCSDAIKHGK